MPLLSGPNRPYWPPANLLGDFAGGALLCAFGICAALIKRQRTGQGSVIDSSMTEGVAYLGSYVYAYQDRESFWEPDYGFFSGRCPIFRTYETKDGKFMACGALEVNNLIVCVIMRCFSPNFTMRFLKVTNLHTKYHQSNVESLVLGIDPSDGSQQELSQRMEAAFKSKTRDEWHQIFESL